jgi:hypothetical protein
MVSEDVSFTSPLAPPPPTLQIVEDNLVAAAGGHDLPVPATQRAIGPPTVLDQPGFADRVNFSTADGKR